METIEVPETEETPAFTEKSEAIVGSIQEDDQRIDGATREYLKKSLSIPKYDWKQPIEFYGKVVTVDGQPLAGVTVEYGWTSLTGYDTRTLSSRMQTVCSS